MNGTYSEDYLADSLAVRLSPACGPGEGCRAGSEFYDGGGSAGRTPGDVVGPQAAVRGPGRAACGRPGWAQPGAGGERRAGHWQDRAAGLRGRDRARLPGGTRGGRRVGYGAAVRGAAPAVRPHVEPAAPTARPTPLPPPRTLPPSTRPH